MKFWTCIKLFGTFHCMTVCKVHKVKKGDKAPKRQSSKIRENKGGFPAIIREEKCKQICNLNHT